MYWTGVQIHKAFWLHDNVNELIYRRSKKKRAKREGEICGNHEEMRVKIIAKANGHEALKCQQVIKIKLMYGLNAFVILKIIRVRRCDN